MSTLGLDTHLTEDGKSSSPPGHPGDAEFPHVGGRADDPSLAQIRTLNCDYRRGTLVT